MTFTLIEPTYNEEDGIEEPKKEHWWKKHKNKDV
jgi:hypothetical protein